MDDLQIELDKWRHYIATNHSRVSVKARKIKNHPEQCSYTFKTEYNMMAKDLDHARWMVKELKRKIKLRKLNDNTTILYYNIFHRDGVAILCGPFKTQPSERKNPAVQKRIYEIPLADIQTNYYDWSTHSGTINKETSK